MKWTLLIIGFLALANLANSQTLKTYTGNYEGGSATYQYYENENMERIFHGQYQYREQNLKIHGQFNNNLKDGIWSYEYYDDTYNFYSIASEKLVGKYDNGRMVGEWNYSYYRNDKKTNKVERNIKMTANFSNNNFAKKIYLKEENMYRPNGIVNLDIKGQFNKTGLLDSAWVIKYVQNGYDFETYFKYKDGILYSSFSRNLSNGTIIENFDSTSFINQFINNYDTLSNISSVNSNYFSKAIYQLQLREWNEGADPLDYKYVRNTEANYMFGFNSVLTSETDAAEEISSFLDFWVNLHTGDFFKIKRGSDVKLIYPKCDVLELSASTLKEIEKEKKQREEDERKEKEEEVRIEKERLAAIARKEKFDVAVKTGNTFFEAKKYKQALAEYNSANTIEFSNDVSAKIKSTQKEIDRIDILQRLRLETYSYLKSKYETIAPEITSLKLSLEDKKKVYGKNYELCMNLLNSKFPSYFSSVNAMFNTNKTTGLNIEDTWNETDQDALDLLTKFKDEFKTYEKFHSAVKTAFETENKDQLKLLKSSDDPKEIISKF